MYKESYGLSSLQTTRIVNERKIGVQVTSLVDSRYHVASMCIHLFFMNNRKANPSCLEFCLQA